VLTKIIDEDCYTTQQIFYVNESGLLWKKMRDRTYILKEKNTMPRFKAAKDRIKLLLTTNAAGDCNLKVLLTYHAENSQASANVPIEFMFTQIKRLGRQ
jgi:hypothetical protein